MVPASALRCTTPRAISANINPSRNTPAPLNMRRTVTGPKAENNSRMSSGSMDPAGSVRRRGILRRRQLHGLAAAAGGGLVRVVEHELRRELLGLVVHLGAEQEQHRLGVDQ